MELELIEENSDQCSISVSETSTVLGIGVPVGIAIIFTIIIKYYIDNKQKNNVLPVTTDNVSNKVGDNTWQLQTKSV